MIYRYKPIIVASILLSNIYVAHHDPLCSLLSMDVAWDYIGSYAMIRPQSCMQVGRFLETLFLLPFHVEQDN